MMISLLRSHKWATSSERQPADDTAPQSKWAACHRAAVLMVCGAPLGALTLWPWWEDPHTGREKAAGLAQSRCGSYPSHICLLPEG